MENSIIIEHLGMKISKADIMNLVQYNPNDVIYISGSIVEGFSNKYSDLDIYVLMDEYENSRIENLDYNFDKYREKFGRIGDIQCDIEYWPKSLMLTLIEQLNNMDLNNLNVRSKNQIKIENYTIDDMISFVYRFTNSLPVYNEEKYNELKAELNINKFCRFVTRKYINDVDHKFMDIFGNLDNDKPETALICARHALLKTITFYLFSWEITSDNTKWLHEKLKKISLVNNETLEVYNNFLSLYYYPNLMNRNDVKNNVEDIVNFINEVINVIEKRLGGI